MLFNLKNISLTLWKVVLLVLVLHSAVTVGRMYLNLTEREQESAHGTLYLRGNRLPPWLLLTWMLLLHPLLSFIWWLRQFIHLHDISLYLRLRLKEERTGERRIFGGYWKRFIYVCVCVVIQLLMWHYNSYYSEVKVHWEVYLCRTGHHQLWCAVFSHLGFCIPRQGWDRRLVQAHLPYHLLLRHLAHEKYYRNINY